MTRHHQLQLNNVPFSEARFNLALLSTRTVILNSPTRPIADREPALGGVWPRAERGAGEGAGGARSRLNDERAVGEVVEEGSDAVLGRRLAQDTAVVGGGGGGLREAECVIGE